MSKQVPDETKADWIEAARLSDAGDTVSELKYRQKMVENHPASAKLRVCLGFTYKELEDFGRAEAEFVESVKLAPKWELASLQLFHLFWDQDRREEAMDELGRFMKVSYSQDYMDIVREINQKYPDD